MTTDEDFFESKAFREKLADYEQSIAEGRSPFMDADDLTDIADYYNYKGHVEEAHDAIDLALEIHPGATMPLVFKSREALQNGDLETAMEYAGMIEDQNDPEAQYLNAEMIIARENPEDADRYLLDEYEHMNPDRKTDFMVDVANIWNEYMYHDKAYEWAMRIKQTDETEVKELIGRIMFGLKRYKESGDIFEELVDRKPFSLSAWYALASAQFMDQNPSEALKSIEFALAINPEHPDCLMLKGNILMRKDNFAEAAEFFRRYSRQMPDDMLACINLASCYLNINRMEDARQMVEKALDSDDDDILLQACENMVFIELASNNNGAAMEWAEKAEQFTDDASESLMLKGHVMLCDKKPEEAMQIFQDAIMCAANPNAAKIRMIASLFDNGYNRLAICAIRYYCKELHDITDEELESMTPEKLIEYIKNKQEQN